MTTKKAITKRDDEHARQAAHVARFIEGGSTPAIFRNAMFCLMAHAQNATGIKIVVGEDCDGIDRDALARFIERAESLGYDENGGLFDQEDGEYLIKTTPAPDSNEALARHLSEALRITRERDDLPAGFYNDLADAVLNFENDLPSLTQMNEGEPHILLTLETYAAQTKARTKKGGGDAERS